ncbi:MULTISPECIES: thiamine phosphate synthase [Niastella]|uniref:Thiamine phosphate synthase n=1 Tax=Niastella soli TaxID=2821487 RepID=A0ABS3Z1P7_9BACT|nr:thiamine phosphate synthase [Niastella soli]MBO9204083.1 thiamine phosphate synthase [Niastella soli]
MFTIAVISNATAVPNEATIIQQLFAEGLEVFHLRKPEADEQTMRQLIEAIPAVYHDRIAMHGFYHLMEEYNIHRWHFREEHRQSTTKEELVKLKDKGYTLSTSVHELPTLQRLTSLFSYAFFSPVFDSISKHQYKGIAGDDFYLKAEQKPVPVLALGGVEANNIHSLVTMNFDGAALLGAIWQEPEMAVENFKLCKHNVHTY